MRPREILSLFVASAVITACSGSPHDDASTTSSEALSGGSIVGTWGGTNAYAYGGRCENVYASSLTRAGYGSSPGAILTDTCGFQCVELAVRYFNYAKGIPASGWRVGTAIEMCNSHPSGVSPTTNPQPGDLVVLHANDSAVGTGYAGHVAVVTGVNGDTISTFNQNWANDTTAFARISRGRDVACFLHAGGSAPPPGATCSAQESTNATLNGHHYWTCEGGSRYICDDRGSKIAQSCGGGCRGAGVGADDQCGVQGPACTASEKFNSTLNGAHYWTCEGNGRFICDDRGNKVTQGCRAGCQGMGAGSDDVCR